MSSEKVIKSTTIERGVRIAHGGEDDAKAFTVAAVKQKRDHDKQVLGQLNDRFAKYIDRTKFLEGQNKKLIAELEELRHKWGEQSRQVRDLYEPELLIARATIDDTTREKANSEIKAKRIEYEATNLKRQYDDVLQLIHQDKNKINFLEQLHQENQDELDMLKHHINDCESDIEKYKKETNRLNEEYQRLLTDLDKETLRRVELEYEKQTLEEQIPFLSAIHEQEMAELRSIQSGAQMDPAKFYRHELEKAIRDIRGDFDDLNDQQKRELEEWYKVKTEEIMQQMAKLEVPEAKIESTESLRIEFEENKRQQNDLKQKNANLFMRLNQCEEELETLRRNNSSTIEEQSKQISNIKTRLQELMDDYDELMKNKSTLEFEINTYRRLLESEEVRTSK
jgi:intermediate filament protein if